MKLKPTITAVSIFALMALTAVGAHQLTPTKSLAAEKHWNKLGASIPEQAGDWTKIVSAANMMVSPDLQQKLDEFYSDLYTETFVDTRGYPIMVSVAYGETQSDQLRVHSPEVCYPAQGFTIVSRKNDTVALPDGRTLPVVRLVTKNQNRVEPVTYWITIGTEVANRGLNRKFAQLRYGLEGFIPDGLLFRVSSVDRDIEASFKKQDEFIRTIASSVDASSKVRFFGATGGTNP